MARREEGEGGREAQRQTDRQTDTDRERQSEAERERERWLEAQATRRMHVKLRVPSKLSLRGPESRAV